jgi:hypothetical protein
MQGIIREVDFFKLKRNVICFTHPYLQKKKKKNQNLDCVDFKSLYVIISYARLKAHAFDTYPILSKFLALWDRFKKFKCIPLVGVECTPPTCWTLRLRRPKAQ